jgi:hypothetical protein
MNWLIKLLGGVPAKEYDRAIKANEKLLAQLHVYAMKLKQAQKNDTPKDPKTGRFMKVKK